MGIVAVVAVTSTRTSALTNEQARIAETVALVDKAQTAVRDAEIAMLAPNAVRQGTPSVLGARAVFEQTMGELARKPGFESERDMVRRLSDRGAGLLTPTADSSAVAGTRILVSDLDALKQGLRAQRKATLTEIREAGRRALVLAMILCAVAASLLMAVL